jgi:hypothetical protein
MDTAILVVLFFLAGVGVGTFAVGSFLKTTLNTAKAEFAVLRAEARAEITEAENVIRRVGKAL